MKEMKIMCMRVAHLGFLGSIYFLPFALCTMLEAFGLTVNKSWYLHYFNKQANMVYVGKIPGFRIMT